MLKKYASTFFLFVACMIMVGHNIIPHHHHDNKHDLAAHHQNSHHHDGETDHKDLSHLFSHFVHAADHFTLTANKSIRILPASLIALIPDKFSLVDIANTPLLHETKTEHILFISPHGNPSGLRAPPAVFI